MRGTSALRSSAILSLVCGAALFTLGGCGAEEMAEDAMPSTDLEDASVAKPTFTNVRAQVLATCSGPIGCHRRAFFGGGLDLTDANAYKSLINVLATEAPTKLRVKPGDAANSFLVQKLLNKQTMDEGGPMPRSEGASWTKLSAAKISLVQRWIAAGAPNN